MQIETSRLLLRPFRKSDASILSDLGNDQDKALWLPDWSMDDAHAVHLISWLSACWRRSDPTKAPVIWAIVAKETGQVIGHCGIGPKAELGGVVELGYAVAAAYRGRCVATEAAKAAIWWAFARARLPFLTALVHPGNAASRRVLDKLGFVPAGTRRIDFGGQAVDYDCLRLHDLDTPSDPQWRVNIAAEDMETFFDRRADGYDDHMRLAPDHDRFYAAAVEPIAPTEAPVEVLDLGCGTGLELQGLFARAPHARVTCVDLSGDMLALLQQTYRAQQDQITVVQASYLGWSFPDGRFDHVLSVNTMHHFWEEQKVRLYRDIHRSLKSGGTYIEADFMVDEVMMEQYRRRYWRLLASRPDSGQGGRYHVDIPFTVLLQKQLLTTAGFAAVHSHWERIQPEWSGAVLAARK